MRAPGTIVVSSRARALTQIGQRSSSPPFRELILEASTACIQKVAAILQAASERGELQLEGPSTEAALTFLVLTNALLLQASQSTTGSPTIDELPVTVTRLFLYGVAART
jgi:hypothetical protein